MPKCYLRLPNLTVKEIKRLWSFVNIGHPDDCWEWKGSTQPAGYGIFWVTSAQKHFTASRLIYKLCFTEPPTSKGVCHTCDNPPCCNPAHFFLGDDAANRADCVTKNRQARGEKLSRALVGKQCHGINHPSAKLSEDDVREIRRLYVPRKTGFRKLARRFGVQDCTILKVLRRQSWKHIE